jgi:hypothetical protein
MRSRWFAWAAFNLPNLGRLRGDSQHGAASQQDGVKGLRNSVTR